MRVLHHGKVVAEIPNEALTDDAPLYHRPMDKWEHPLPKTKPGSIALGKKPDLTADFHKLLASPNICSKKWVYEQYDSMVQTNTVEGPGLEAGVIRVKGTNRGLAMALDGNSRWCYLDPKLGAMHAVAEACRNVACSGAKPLAATNCLNFGNPEKPPIMQQFSETIDGLTEACEKLNTPITGGNVSFYNETLGEGIYPTPVIGIVGILEDVHKAVQPNYRSAGKTLVLISGARQQSPADAEISFGSSEYAKELLESVWGKPPALDIDKEAALHKTLADLANQGLLDSAKDISEGGIATTIAEAGFARNLGATVDLTSNGSPYELLLFGESASQVVISCTESNLQAIQQVAVNYGLQAQQIGKTVPKTLEIRVDGKTVISAPVASLRKSWEQALKKALHVDTPEHLVPEILQKS
jgi:phosphoribosylformylglycinamidine synthase